MKLGKKYTKSKNIPFLGVGFFCLLPKKTGFKSLSLLLNLLVSLSISAQDSTNFYISPNTVVVGLELVHTTPQENPKTTQQPTDENTTVKKEITSNNIEIKTESLLLAKNKKVVVNFSSKKNNKKTTKQENTETQNQQSKINPCPFSGDYPMGLCYRFSILAVVAPTNSNSYQKFQFTAIISSCFKQGKMTAKTSSKNFFGYTNPTIANIITIALSNRPPPSIMS